MPSSRPWQEVRGSWLAEPNGAAVPPVGSRVSPLLSMWRVGLAGRAATSLALGRRGEKRNLVGTVGADCGGKELVTLPGRGSARQVDEREAGGLVGSGVQAVVYAFTGDLAQPRVVVKRTVDSVPVKLIGEIGIRVGVRRGSHSDHGRRDHCRH